MDFGSRIFFGTLNNLGYSTGRTTNTNEGQVVLLEPGILVQTAHDKGAHIIINIGGHFVANIKHTRSVYGTQGQGNALQNLAVLEQNQLRTATAQVENNTIFHIQGIDNAQVADVSLRFARNNVQLNAGLLRHLGYQLGAIGRVANGCCSHRNGLIRLIYLAHMGKAAHGVNGAGEGFLREHVLPIHLLAQPQRFLLVVDHIIGPVFVDMTDNQARRVGADIYDCYSLHIPSPPSNFKLPKYYITHKNQNSCVET